MEPNFNPLVPDNSNPSQPPKPASPYTPSEPGAKAEQLTNSTFQSRTISPLAPTTPPDPAHLSSEPMMTASAVPEPAVSIPTGMPSVMPEPQVMLQPSAVPPPADPMPAVAPVVSNAFVGADMPPDPNQNAFQPVIPVAPGMKPPKQPRKFNFKSKPALAGLVIFILVIGFAAYYFGYKTNPSVIYSQSLSNTAKGYDKLVEYTNEQSKIKYKGSTGTGSFSLKSGGSSTDGKIAFKSDDKNGELTFDVGLGATRVSFDGRLIDSGANSADIYLKASGLKGLGSLIGSSSLDEPLANLDNSWIVIDHTLLDSLSGGSTSGAEGMLPPSAAQILSAAQGFGKVNQDYLFTTDKDKAVMKITKKHGMEDVDGHNTYHYTVALQKDNVKAYIDAQKAALKASTLNKWLKDNGYDETFYAIFDSMKDSADSIKSTDTFDMWADIDQRLIYKVRFAEKSNPVNNYIDVGLDYKGGNDFPFFIAGQSKDDTSKTTAKAVMNLNTDTQVTDFTLDVKSTGYDDATFKMKVSFKPTKEAVKIEKPANAKSLAQVLSELGYGDLLTELQAYSAMVNSSSSSNSVNSGVQSKAKDSKRQSDIRTLQTNLEAFYSANGYYPSLAEFNSASWRKTNMKSLDPQALQDPDGSSMTLVSAPKAKAYAYKVTDASGKSCEADSSRCALFTLTATLSTGKAYSVESLQ